MLVANPGQRERLLMANSSAVVHPHESVEYLLRLRSEGHRDAALGSGSQTRAAVIALRVVASGTYRCNRSDGHILLTDIPYRGRQRWTARSNLYISEIEKSRRDGEGGLKENRQDRRCCVRIPADVHRVKFTVAIEVAHAHKERRRGGRRPALRILECAVTIA